MKDWVSIELLGYTYYSKRGYRILVPLVINKGYDFIAEKEGEFIKVNVKSAHKHGSNWCISTSMCETKQGTQCDIFLAWLPEKNKFIELPGDFFKKSRMARISTSLYEAV